MLSLIFFIFLKIIDLPNLTPLIKWILENVFGKTSFY